MNQKEGNSHDSKTLKQLYKGKLACYNVLLMRQIFFSIFLLTKAKLFLVTIRITLLFRIFSAEFLQIDAANATWKNFFEPVYHNELNNFGEEKKLPKYMGSSFQLPKFEIEIIRIMLC